MQLTRTARGPVRHCRREDNRKYCPSDMSSSIHVCRHRCAIVQGRPFYNSTQPHINIPHCDPPTTLDRLIARKIFVA